MRVIIIMVMTLSLLIGPVSLAQDDKSKTPGSKENVVTPRAPIINPERGNTCQVSGGEICTIQRLLPIGSSCCCLTNQGKICNGRIVQ